MEFGSPRTKSAILGLPAVVVGILGIALLVIASSSQENALLDRYAALAETSNADFRSEFVAFAGFVKEKGGDQSILENVGQDDANDGGSAQAELKNEIELRRSKLKQLREDEILFYEKLIHLQPSNDEFRYRHALAYKFYDENQMWALVNALAPENFQGYAPAQLEMAGFFQRMAQAKPENRLPLLSRALKHADNCLIQDKENFEALRIRAAALFALKRYEQAFEAFKKIVSTNPEFFSALIEVNNLRGNSKDDNTILLNNAKLELSKKLIRSRPKPAEWETTLITYVDCLYRLDQFEALRSVLATERTEFDNATDKTIRLRIIDRLLARSIVTLIGGKLEKLSKSETDKIALGEEITGLIMEAHAIEPNLIDLPKQVTSLMLLVPELKAKLLTIYDPYNDPQPSFFVLEKLGVDALTKENYTEAVQLLEKARSAAPNNPTILNNLAYAYLSSAKPDPNRALYLSGQALAVASENQQMRDPLFMSGIRHTHGTALMALERYTEAAGDFQDALAGRPDHVGILESLIRCYEKIDPTQVEVYRARLNEILANKAASSPK